MLCLRRIAGETKDEMYKLIFSNMLGRPARSRLARGVLSAALLVVVCGNPRLLGAAEQPEGERPAAPPAVAAPAAAGPVEEMAVDTALAKRINEVREIRQRATPPDDAQRRLLEEYYSKYALARWTLKENEGKLSDGTARSFRRELRNDLTYPRSGAHDALNEIALNVLQGIAKGNYHPPARYNAMLAISELNEIEPQGGDPGKPWNKTVPVMLAAVGDPQQADYVRVAALIGVLRHVRAKSLTDELRQNVTDACLRLVNATQPPAGRTPEGHAWLKAQAADILGELGRPGPKGEVLIGLGKMAGDRSTLLLARRAAIRALAKLDVAGVSPENAAAAALGVAAFVHDACQMEEDDGLVGRRIKERIAIAEEAAKRLQPVVGEGKGRDYLAVVQPVLKSLVEALGGSESTAMPVIRQQREKLQPLLN